MDKIQNLCDAKNITVVYVTEEDYIKFYDADRTLYISSHFSKKALIEILLGLPV